MIIFNETFQTSLFHVFSAVRHHGEESWGIVGCTHRSHCLTPFAVSATYTYIPPPRGKKNCPRRQVLGGYSMPVPFGLSLPLTTLVRERTRTRTTHGWAAGPSSSRATDRCWGDGQKKHWGVGWVRNASLSLSVSSSCPPWGSGRCLVVGLVLRSKTSRCPFRAAQRSGRLRLVFSLAARGRLCGDKEMCVGAPATKADLVSSLSCLNFLHPSRLTTLDACALKQL